MAATCVLCYLHGLYYHGSALLAFPWVYYLIGVVAWQ